MLTIKQVTTGGEIFFWEGINIRLVQRRQGPKTYDDRILYFDQPQGDGVNLVCSIDRGTVYIMNSAGKTVDRFTLTPPEEAQPQDPPAPAPQQLHAGMGIGRGLETPEHLKNLLASVGRNDSPPQDLLVPPLKAAGDRPIIMGQRGNVRLRRVDGVAKDAPGSVYQDALRADQAARIQDIDYVEPPTPSGDYLEPHL